MKSTEILVRIRKIYRAIKLESSKIQKEYGVSIPQMLCLGYLRSQEDFQASHKEITKYLNLNSSTATGIVNRLEKRGYVARLPKREDDKRSTFVVLTSSGMKLLDNTPPLLQDLLAKKIDKLPDNEVDTIIGSLDKLITFLDVDGIGAAPMIADETDLDSM
ncbi:MAG: MarR family transcriptional regulator [Marinilabiliales bacterium]|nr:MAG: MarR family transcriptional regulator [Marinilabiliales bacterium]